MLINIKMKKKKKKKKKKKTFVAELGHNGRLKFTSTLKKFTSTHLFKSISPKWLGIFG